MGISRRVLGLNWIRTRLLHRVYDLDSWSVLDLSHQGSGQDCREGRAAAGELEGSAAPKCSQSSYGDSARRGDFEEGDDMPGLGDRRQSATIGGEPGCFCAGADDDGARACGGWLADSRRRQQRSPLMVLVEVLER